MACRSDSEPKRVRLSRLSTSEQIQAMKVEIRTKIQLLRDRLDEKECELLAEVDRLGALQVSERKELEEQIEELNKQTSSQSTHNRLTIVREALQSTIEDINRKLEQFQEIHSNWETENFETYFDSLCSLNNVTNVDSIYQSKSTQKWSILIGDKPSELSSPTSLAVQQRTDDVFVSDSDGNRIQVYSSSGEHIRMIDKFRGPFDIFFVTTYFIFASNKNSSGWLGFGNTFNILEVELSTLSVLNVNVIPNSSKFLTMKHDAGTSTKSFYYYQNNKSITKFDAIKFNPNAPLSYKIDGDISIGKPKGITPVSMQVHNDSLYLLVSSSDNLIYKFNATNFAFIRSFLPSSQLSAAKSVCVDGRGNLLVAGGEGDSTKVLCLSPDGDLIHELFLPHHNCVSVAVNSKFDVSILCSGDTYGLISM